MIKTTRTHVGDSIENRYAYDFGLCSTTGDWAQMDTAQDAPWFGQWANPFERKILCYAEGDRTLIECGDDTEFTAELERIAEFHTKNDKWKGIDTWSTRLCDRFAAAGAGHLVHPSCLAAAEKDRAGATGTAEATA